MTLFVSLIFTAMSSLASTIVLGMIDAQPLCKNQAAQVWFSKNDVLIYQIEVPAQGHFELHTIPGEYSLVANTQSGCFIEKKITLTADKKYSVALKLQEPTRKPAFRKTKRKKR